MSVFQDYGEFNTVHMENIMLQKSVFILSEIIFSCIAFFQSTPQALWKTFLNHLVVSNHSLMCANVCFYQFGTLQRKHISIVFFCFIGKCIKLYQERLNHLHEFSRIPLALLQFQIKDTALMSTLKSLDERIEKAKTKKNCIKVSVQL